MALTADLTLVCRAFEPGGTIPNEFTKDGDDVSPALTWQGAPEDTVSWAVVMDDPDAPRGTFTHWLVYDLPADTRNLRQGLPREGRLAEGGLQGTNDFGEIGWGGPRPPSGETHRYYLRLFALDTHLDLSEAVRRDALMEAMQGHVLAKTEVMARYGR